jgi:uncharacterized membrane protein (UPF0127 family)
MTQMTASAPSQSTGVWAQRARDAATWLAIAAVAFVLGMFVFGPARQRAEPTYLPASFVGLPTGVVELRNSDGPGALLPVRIADTSQTRLVGFREVGEEALENQFLLYAQTRQTAGRSSYSLEKVRVQLELAVIDGEGNVVAVTTTNPGQERISIAEPHRWLLAAKNGTLAHYGIAPGTRLDVESIRKINL